MRFGWCPGGGGMDRGLGYDEGRCLGSVGVGGVQGWWGWGICVVGVVGFLGSIR